MTSYQGNAVSAGVAVGAVLKYHAYVPLVEDRDIAPEQAAEEIHRWKEVRAQAGRELDALCISMAERDPEQAKIFSAHLEILMDEAIEEDILMAIEEDGMAPECATEQIFNRYAKRIAKSKDELLRARAADIYDVKLRLLRCWDGVPEKNLSVLQSPVIIVAHDLFPSDTATLDQKHVLAIVTEVGGSTSHSAIIARSYGIPALVGVENCITSVRDGMEVGVDALDGTLFVEPDEDCRIMLAEKKAKFLKTREDAERYRYMPGTTANGERVEIELNLGAPDEKDLEAAKYVDGVGLFRTEFLYMGRGTLPSEEEQLQVYRHILESFPEKPVILRTLDIGGDKKLDSLQLPAEENPFLGNRALRLCLSHPDLFRTQLRACLRASVYGQLWIMFPMVGGMEDLYLAKEQLAQVRGELDAEGLPYAENIKVGVMIEIPSAALMADFLAEETDFASIGTNDLTQYTMAADRMNPEVRQYYRFYHPSLFRMIGYVADEYGKRGKPVSVCGEMGGDPQAAAVLVGLGIRRLSMGRSAVPSVKKMLSQHTAVELIQLAADIKQQKTEDCVKNLLQQKLH